MSDYQADIDAIETIAAVPTILNVVCRVTGMGFAAVARARVASAGLTVVMRRRDRRRFVMPIDA